MKERYAFPAIFKYEEDAISVEFPDLEECYTCAESTDEAIKRAKEVLGLTLYSREKDKEPIPEPSEIKDIKVEGGNSILYLVDVFMPPIRDKIKNSFVKKTLSIPRYLNDAAMQADINFSATLQDALKKQLNIRE